ncbi:hypothetical protein EMMF5_004099 [Cystobasidiomycetes sp. EMM_F5]
MARPAIATTDTRIRLPLKRTALPVLKGTYEVVGLFASLAPVPPPPQFVRVLTITWMESDIPKDDGDVVAHHAVANGRRDLGLTALELWNSVQLL